MKEKTFEQILQEHDDMMNATDRDSYVNPVLMDGYKDNREFNSAVLKAKTIFGKLGQRSILNTQALFYFSFGVCAVVGFVKLVTA